MKNRLSFFLLNMEIYYIFFKKKKVKEGKINQWFIIFVIIKTFTSKLYIHIL